MIQTSQARIENCNYIQANTNSRSRHQAIQADCSDRQIILNARQVTSDKITCGYLHIPTISVSCLNFAFRACIWFKVTSQILCVLPLN